MTGESELIADWDEGKRFQRLIGLSRDICVSGQALRAIVVDPGAHGVWIADLVIEFPPMLIGGVLLWQRQPLGYVAGAGLLLQFGMMPILLAASMVLRGLLSATARDVATIAGLLVFSAVAFVPLVFFVRGAASQPGRPVASPFASSH